MQFRLAQRKVSLYTITDSRVGVGFISLAARKTQTFRLGKSENRTWHEFFLTFARLVVSRSYWEAAALGNATKMLPRWPNRASRDSHRNANKHFRDAVKYFRAKTIFGDIDLSLLAYSLAWTLKSMRVFVRVACAFMTANRSGRVDCRPQSRVRRLYHSPGSVTEDLHRIGKAKQQQTGEF